MNETNPNQSNIKIVGWLTVLIAFGWIVLLSLAQPISWMVQDETSLMGTTVSIWPAVIVSIVQTALLLPLALAAWLWRSHSPRFRAWLETAVLAALFPLFLLPLRFFTSSTHPDRATTTILLQLIGLAAYYLFLLAYRKLRKIPAIAPRSGWLLSLLLAPVLMIGWWYVGAFGSLGDVVVNLIVGLLYGRVMGWLIGHFLLEPLYQNTAGPGWDIALGSLGVGAVLVITAESFGFSGQILLFLLLMPSIAWPLMGALRLGGQPDGRSWGIAAWLIGLVMASMLILTDVDELTLLLLLDTSELFTQLVQATAVTILIGRILGLILWLARNQLPRLSLGLLFKAVTTVVWAALLALLIFKPNAGFHRDHLLVILSDQADVSAAVNIADIDQRRQFVYDTLTNHANQTQAPLRQSLDRFRIGYEPYYMVNAIEVEGGPLLRLWLNQFDGVDRVLHNPELRPLSPLNNPPLELIPPSDPPDTTQWNLTMIGADRVWQEFGVRGAGVTLGESDSGVQWDHPELLDSYRGRLGAPNGGHDYNWLDAWYGQPLPYDKNNHGTHTTATVVGNSVGVAPDAEWFACANLIRNLGSPGTYLACMQFMLAPTPFNGDPFTEGRPSLAADVLNNSWGCPTLEGCDPTSLQPAVAALRSAGIFVVASGGNEGTGGCSTIDDPIALYDESFTVGAHDASGQVAGFSSRGVVTADDSSRIKPDILAPGVSVLSAIPDDKYAHFDGTSMAGPHVAGVVALMWSANPNLIGAIDETEQILVATAVPYDYTTNGTPECGNPNITPDNAVGYGLVNAYEAVKMTLAEK